MKWLLLILLVPFVASASFEISNSYGDSTHSTTYEDNGSTTYETTNNYNSGSVTSSYNSNGDSSFSLSNTYGDTTVKSTYDTNYDSNSGYDYQGNGDYSVYKFPGNPG